MTEEKEKLFSVFAETEDYERPLFLNNLSFGQLIEDIVIPFDKKEPFFIDGKPTERSKIRRIKILRQKERFLTAFEDLHVGLRRGSPEQKKIYADQYHIRLEASMREGGEDVTSQIIQAYNMKIKPSLKDYFKNRPELIESAFKIFLEGLKILRTPGSC